MTEPRFAMLRRRQPLQLPAEASPTVDEDERLGFELVLPDDATAAAWRIRFGDRVPDKPVGKDLDVSIRWENSAWFDCCRGLVTVTLERHADPEAAGHEPAGWERVLSASVLVHPAKLTDDEWLAMRADLEAVAVDLANDLLGKAGAGVARARRARTPLDDLAAARQLLTRLDRAVAAIIRQPHTVLQAAPDRIARTPRRLDGGTLKGLLSRGVNPRRYPTGRSAQVSGSQALPSYDVREHRQIVGTLQSVVRTLSSGEVRARREIIEIEGDRPWRMRPGDLPGESLYDRRDEPRVQRLRWLLVDNARLRHWASQIAAAPVLSGLRAERQLRTSPVSRHRPAYRLALRASRAWQSDGRVQIDAGDLVRRKDTDRMYEQWVFLQMAAALRALGFAMDRKANVFRTITARRYMIDLPRGALLSFTDLTGAHVELRFEPWIRPQEAARKMEDLFFHGKGRDAAWSPDILLTLRTPAERHARAIVIDAKYTRQVGDQHWNNLRKYIQIRRLSDNGSPVGQVWIAAPGAEGVTPEDDSIVWGRRGPDVPVGVGIYGTIGLRPGATREAGGPVKTMLEFLEGLLAYWGVASVQVE